MDVGAGGIVKYSLLPFFKQKSLREMGYLLIAVLRKSLKCVDYQNGILFGLFTKTLQNTTTVVFSTLTYLEHEI